MRCYRRKKKRIARFITLAAMPIMVAAGASAVKRGTAGGEKKMLSISDSAAALRTDEDSVKLGRFGENKIFPDESAFLSSGYGIIDESGKHVPYLRLPSPLDMKTDDIGEKPYPTEWHTDGEIIRATYGKYSGSTFFDLENGGQVNNKTDIPNETLIHESEYLPNFTVKNTDEPLVLIYHTHTTESFEPYVRESYDSSFNYRTTDSTKNVVMVGDAVQAELEALGIGVIHAVDIHDYPSYNGSYGRSRETILPILEKYPSIKVVIDIHRDAISGEGYAYQPFVEIDGREAAQIMIISGCDDGTLGMPNYMENFHFACALQSRLESDHEGLTRPVLFDYRHYNQDLTNGSLLIEIGSHGNTLEQVQFAGQLFGRSLGELLISMRR